MFRSTFRLRAALGGVGVTLFAFALACSSAPAAPVESEPSINPDQLRSIVQEAVKGAVPQAPAQQPAVSAQEIQRLVEAAVSAAAPEGATPEEIRSMVEQAVSASAKPGATRSEIAEVVAKAVSESAASQSGVSAADVKKIVTDAISAIPTAAPVVIERVVEITPEPVVASDIPTPDGNFGGTVRWAEESTQVTLDVHKTTTGSRVGAANAQETLFAFDANLVPQPNLVASWSASGDGLSWEFALREGIKYHNGDAFDSTDAVKSYERWMDRDNFGQIVQGFIESIDTPDSLTFTMKLNEPTGLLLDSFARFGGHEPMMMPESMYGVDPAEGPPPGDMEAFSGTGAFELVQWNPGVNMVFERYEDYKSPGGSISFRAGPKFAYADTLEAIIIPELGSRIAALETGEIHFAGTIPGEQRARIEANPETEAYIEPTSVTRWGIWPNHEAGPFSIPEVRRALMMAYPFEDALIVISGSRDLYQACGTLVLCGNARWGGIRTPGDEIYYGPRDLETARQLVMDAGVAGEEITLLSVKGTANTEAPALITKNVLEELGFTVDFQAVDRATYSERRSDPAIMDLFHTGGGMSWGGISPLLNSSISKDTYWNRYKDPSGDFTAKLEEFARADSARQDELVKEMQVIFFKDLQYIPIGETFPVWGIRKELQGVKHTLMMSSGASYVNAWLDN